MAASSKRPPNGYQLFKRENKDKLQELAGGRKSATDISKAGAELWAQQSQKTKQAYQEKAAKLKEEFQANGGIIEKRSSGGRRSTARKDLAAFSSDELIDEIRRRMHEKDTVKQEAESSSPVVKAELAEPERKKRKSSLPLASDCAADDGFEIGEEVLAKYDGSWYTAVVKTVLEGNRCTVEFEDASVEDCKCKRP
eukprot:TRINITY_DN65136_c0_g1_i1.p1 TRINITY_DN65136_c0_g1~~TRINITY_DN65136_c0_g1_i1.p1  ORF type:complete len:196 (+),score=54.41 TRINITY_DN65136_c0_g1_i1:74-661(+)